MHDQQAVQMMRRCAEEIRGLRGQVEYLQPKADAYDNLATVLRLLPRQSVGMSEDLVWTLEREIKALQTELAAQGGADPA